MSSSILLHTRSALLVEFFQSELSSVSNVHVSENAGQLVDGMRAYPEARLFIDGRDLPRDIYELMQTLTRAQPAPRNPVTLLVQRGSSSKLPAYHQAFTGFEVLEKPLTHSQLNAHMDKPSNQPLESRQSADPNPPRPSPAVPGAASKPDLPFPSSPPVKDYFVWDETGRRETASSRKAEQFDDAMTYSMQICQRLAEETGWGDFYEIHGYSNDQACGFFSADSNGELKTYGIMMGATTSMQDFIAASRARASKRS